MVAIVVPLGALAFLAFVVAGICRLISQAMLNRTIRKALDADPASARLLIDKLGPQARSSAGLIGWIMVVAGVAIGTLGVVDRSEGFSDSLPIAATSVAIGLGILLYAWWTGRSPAGTARRDVTL